MLFVLSTAFGVFGTNPISGYLHSVIAYLPLVFIAIVILVLGFAIAAAAKALIENSLGGLSYGTLLANAASTVIIAVGWPGGVSPPGSHGTVRDSLPSHGSSHPGSR